MYMRNKS